LPARRCAMRSGINASEIIDSISRHWRYFSSIPTGTGATSVPFQVVVAGHLYPFWIQPTWPFHWPEASCQRDSGSCEAPKSRSVTVSIQSCSWPLVAPRPARGHPCHQQNATLPSVPALQSDQNTKAFSTIQRVVPLIIPFFSRPKTVSFGATHVYISQAHVTSRPSQG
jgi:hypothetical protein